MSRRGEHGKYSARVMAEWRCASAHHVFVSRKAGATCGLHELRVLELSAEGS